MAEAMAPNSPRTSAGASGFGSQVSNWLCPPLATITMTDFARPNPEESPRPTPLPFASRACRRRQAGEPHQAPDAQPLAAGHGAVGTDMGGDESKHER